MVLGARPITPRKNGYEISSSIYNLICHTVNLDSNIARVYQRILLLFLISYQIALQNTEFTG